MTTSSTYSKPFLTVDQQLDRLVERGMAYTDRESAYRQLQAIGYYRMSGYWYPFRVDAASADAPRPSTFRSGISLETVVEIYRFDERLRSAILHATSLIEVAMRFRIGHLLGQKHQFAHMHGLMLDQDWSTPDRRSSSGPNCTDACGWMESKHQSWVNKQVKNESVSNEAFVAHIHQHYGKPLPVWSATEVMSFGTLTRLFDGMTQVDRQQVAVDFDVYTADGNGDAATLSNWLEHLRQTRNICAHHSRLWNRNHTVPLSSGELSEFSHLRGAPAGPHQVRTVSRPASRVYGTLVLIAYLLARIDYANVVRDELRGLVEDFARIEPTRLHAMGFPDGWAKEVVWQASYARDAVLARRAHLLRNVLVLYTAQAAELLSVKSTQTERHGLLNYYRKNGAVLSVPGTEAHRYPGFQFARGTGDIEPLCMTANRRLLDGSAGTEEQRWDALQWWMTADDRLPGASSPREALEEGALTSGLLDVLLKPREDE